MEVIPDDTISGLFWHVEGRSVLRMTMNENSVVWSAANKLVFVRVCNELGSSCNWGYSSCDPWGIRCSEEDERLTMMVSMIFYGRFVGSH